jgi:hypothetical protein
MAFSSTGSSFTTTRNGTVPRSMSAAHVRIGVQPPLEPGDESNVGSVFSLREKKASLCGISALVLKTTNRSVVAELCREAAPVRADHLILRRFGHQ